MKSPVAGLIVGRLNHPLVYQGDALYHIAMLEGDPDAEQVVEDLTSDLGPDDFWPQLK